MPKRLTQKQIIDALHEARGNLSIAALNLGCARKTIYNRMDKNEKIKAAHAEGREIGLDYSESKLFSNIGKGKESSIFYHLNNQGESRGYNRPIKIAPTDPTGKKEYAGNVRNAILGKLLPELTDGDSEGTG